LTTAEVADRLGVIPETILRWVRSGKLPAIRLSAGAIRFRESELEAWLDAHTSGTNDADRKCQPPDASPVPALVLPTVSHHEPTRKD
jgi:excisionase family DNA binding protein